MVDRMVKGRPDPAKAMAKLNAQIPIGRWASRTRWAETSGNGSCRRPPHSLTGSEVLVDGGLIAG